MASAPPTSAPPTSAPQVTGLARSWMSYLPPLMVYVAAGIAVSLFHYFTESFMWRRSSTHRRYVAFST